MRKAYRSPRQVLMAAHYFGMGLKREDGAVQAITTQPGWENLGYDVVEGDFRKSGEDIRIRRPKQNSPHPLSEHDNARPFVRFSAAETKKEEIELIGENISRDINDHGLAPEQIMVILLDQKTESEANQPTDHLESTTDDNIVLNRVWDGETSIFAKDGEVTVTRINRAKGNEAAMVYIAGLEHVDDVSSGQTLVQRRNQAFVAMTRTRGWCHVTGTGSCDAFDEIRSVIDDITTDEPEMVFPAPDLQSLENEMEAEPESMTLDDFVPEEE